MQPTRHKQVPNQRHGESEEIHPDGENVLDGDELEKEVVTVAEMYRRFPNEWVLLEITRDHKDTLQVRGRVIAHSANRDALDEAFEHFRATHPDARTFEFFTGEIAPSDVVVVL